MVKKTKIGRRRRRRPLKPRAVEEGTPVSMIVRKGDVSKSVRRLITDLRKTMMPLTVNKVREQRSNVLEDFVAVAGPLGISHLFAISQRGKNIYLRLAKMPRGATLTFQVLQYSLMGDVRKAQPGAAYSRSPLLALHGFKAAGEATESFDPRSVELMREVFVSMFPAIDIREVRVDNATRRVVLIYHSSPGVVEWRQYAIKREVLGSTPVAALYQHTTAGARTILPAQEIQDLAELVAQVKEVKDEPVDDDEDKNAATNIVTVKSNLLLPPSKNADVQYKRAQNAADVDMKISLVEVGPRLTMKLVRVQSGVFKGDTLFEDPNIGSKLHHMRDIEDIDEPIDPQLINEEEYEDNASDTADE